jgi:hypothetical protein
MISIAATFVTLHLSGPCKVVTVFLAQVTEMWDLFGGTASTHTYLTDLTDLHILRLRHSERKTPDFGYAILPYFLTKHKNMPQECVKHRLVIFCDHRDNREAYNFRHFSGSVLSTYNWSRVETLVNFHPAVV